MSKMNRNRTGQGALMLVAAGLLGLSACKDTQDTPVEADTYSSLVSERGEISFPADFPDGFRFIGSWAVAGEGGVADIHSVYARPSDVDAFRQAGRFPDGAVLIKEVSASRGAKHTTGEAFWPTDTKTWFMMVKDAKGRFGDNPLWGDGWGWAQFDPADTTRQIATDYKTDCQSCHIPAQGNDWIYTYAYPALGPKGQVNLPEGAKTAAMTPDAAGHEASAATDGKGDPAAGKLAFETTCVACHSTVAGKGGVGPSLAGVAGRKAGTGPGYAYSPEMTNSGVTWTPENLAKHLEKPKEFIPGNRMGNLFPNGVRDSRHRMDIVAYLGTLK
ncbi:MAG TPA: cytochrome P460 family protein [Novosphingobium sp.]|nr:cytochrome P460 family protein [Novosphingobium sp.]